MESIDGGREHVVDLLYIGDEGVEVATQLE
jgi:hypothetical protein